MIKHLNHRRCQHTVATNCRQFALGPELSGVKAGLLQAMRGALASGDAPAAASFYRVALGPKAAVALAERSDQMAQIKGWLASQN
jgi:hypothetical protein